MYSFQLPATLVAAVTVETFAIGIVFVISAGLMLVPIVALAILVFVEVRALRASRRAHREAKAATRVDVRAYGGAR
ncbi:MAG: hypothetical protein ABJC79_09460 [Acidimicrobiia bacterium]